MERAKIQLESYGDLQFVRKNLLDYLRVSITTLTGSDAVDAATERELTQEVNEVMALLQQNVQINGFDYDPAQDPASVERLEPVKEPLVRELQSLQAKTDDLMVHVASKRRKVPAQAADAWRARAAVAVGTPEHPSVAVLPAPALAAEGSPATDSPALDLSGAAHALNSGLTLLEQLQVSVPALADKMRRFNDVMVEVPRIQASHMERLMAQAVALEVPPPEAPAPADGGATEAFSARGLATLGRP